MITVIWINWKRLPGIQINWPDGYEKSVTVVSDQKLIYLQSMRIPRYPPSLSAEISYFGFKEIKKARKYSVCGLFWFLDYPKLLYNTDWPLPIKPERRKLGNPGNYSLINCEEKFSSAALLKILQTLLQFYKSLNSFPKVSEWMLSKWTPESLILWGPKRDNLPGMKRPSGPDGSSKVNQIADLTDNTHGFQFSHNKNI